MMLPLAFEFLSPLGPLFNNSLVLVVLFILLAGAIGMYAGSLAVPAWGMYVVFAYLAMETQFGLLTNVFYVVAVLTMLGVGFKLIRLEGWGD